MLTVIPAPGYLHDSEWQPTRQFPSLLKHNKWNSLMINVKQSLFSHVKGSSKVEVALVLVEKR